MSNFDAQNPILGNLLGEIESSKFTDTDVKKCLKKSVKDIEINERLQELKTSLFNNNKDDDDDNNDDVDNNILPLQPPSPPPSPPP